MSIEQRILNIDLEKAYYCGEELRAIALEVRNMEDRIKQLEEALEGTVKWIVHLADSGDAGFWDVEKQSAIIAARAALKKEDKL